jgi:hypothetical protein
VLIYRLVIKIDLVLRTQSRKSFTLTRPTCQKMNLLDVINLLKWILILLNVVSNSTLVWKIWTRKNLHTVFNLGMCLFFFLGGFFGPVMIFDYGNLLRKMINHPERSHPDLCLRIYVCSHLLHQANKIILINIIFR